MSLQLPVRSPITDQQWLRFFQELLDRTGGEDASTVAEIQFVGAGVQQSASARDNHSRRSIAERAFQETTPAKPPEIRRHSKDLAELHFLRGW